MKKQAHHRRIKSFVLREGHLTVGQKRAFETLYPKFGLASDQPYDFVAIFGNHHPVVLEIGFGMGASLLEMAEHSLDKNFVGIEVHTPGVGTVLAEIQKRDLKNLRVVRDDAVDVLKTNIPPHSLDRIHIFFPDPWHKKRHHKRRLITPEFVALLATKLKPAGHLHLATDWEDYAMQMMDVMTHAKGFENTCGEGQFADGKRLRPSTKFEQRGLRLGHGVWDLVFRAA